MAPKTSQQTLSLQETFCSAENISVEVVVQDFDACAFKFKAMGGALKWNVHLLEPATEVAPLDQFSDCLPLLLLRPDGARFPRFRRGQEAVVHTSEAFSAYWAGVVLREESVK